MLADDYDDGVIEVQVIPQDDNWGETATTITETATSICSDLDHLEDAFDDEAPKERFTCMDSRQVISIILSLILGLGSVLSPIAFILLPVVLPKWEVSSASCTIACEGMYIGMGVKEVVLIVGLWALYVRPNKAFLPRLNVFKVGLMSVVYIVVIFFWLFYVFRILGKKEISHENIISFATSFIDCMLFLHFLGIVLMWLRHREKVFTVSVVRNVDGKRKFYNVGQNSVQKTAMYILEQYYVDFTEYNPYMPRPSAKSKMSKLSGLKLYELDGKSDCKLENLSTQASKAMIAAAAVGRRKEGRNDRFYEEQELDRRIRKRRARLVAAAEEAFGHIARLNAYEMTKKAAGAMDMEEASQAIFPTLARPLQKYLRTTRQQLHFPLESIMKHLSHCITFDLSARAFVERYIHDQPCASHIDHSRRGREDWELVCDISPSRQVTAGCVFQLRKNNISLVVVVGRAPVLHINEQAYNSDLNKFILRLNSETSV